MPGDKKVDGKAEKVVESEAVDAEMPVAPPLGNQEEGSMDIGMEISIPAKLVETAVQTGEPPSEVRTLCNDLLEVS